MDLSTGELLIASEIALNETLSNAPSMSRKVPKTYLSGGASLETELLFTNTFSHVMIVLHVPEDNSFLEFQQHW